MWPRDGALVAAAMTRAGYRDIAQRFFTFCADVIKEDGYLLHKYNPDKTLASSWHPWIRDGKLDLPITWSHATLVMVVLDYIEKRRQLMAEAVFAHTIPPV